VLRFSHSGVIRAWRQRERELRLLGVNVTLATARRWNEGGLNVRFTADSDELVQAVTTFGRHPNAFVFDPRPIWRLLGEGWDILDIHEEPCSLATAELLVLRSLRARGVPFLIYSAQNLLKSYPPPFRWIERWTLSRAAGAYVCNTAAGRILRTKGMRGELREIPLGVDTSHFAPLDRDAPRGRLRVGYVGRLEVHKGVDVLIEAISRVSEATLLITGAGPLSDALASFARTMDLTDRITFRGFVDQHGLPDIYRSLDVVAIPSLPTSQWQEQFCRVAVEAMASGIPVVASDTGALPEVVGDAGLLVPPGDAEALGAALRRLLHESGLWRDLRTKAMARGPQFAWSAVAEAQMRLYEAVASR
jgi:glycosyltransferase involved in cell wall biosynthesis